MKMRLKKIIVVLSLLAFSANLFGNTIYFINSSEKRDIENIISAIKVVQKEDGNFIFSFCLINKWNLVTEGAALGCQLIGNELGYSEQKLEMIDEELESEARWNYAEDIALVGIGFAAFTFGRKGIARANYYSTKKTVISKLLLKLDILKKQKLPKNMSQITKTQRELDIEEEILVEASRRTLKTSSLVLNDVGGFSVLGGMLKHFFVSDITRDRSDVVKTVLTNGDVIKIKEIDSSIQELNDYLNDALNQDWD